jgi:hypothetical protein
MRLRLGILTIGILLSAVGEAQEVRSITLHDVTQSAPPQGSRFENSTCGGSKELFSHRASASLDWLETTDLYPGERIGMEVRVENVGTAPFKLPIHASLKDLQSKDPSARLEYYSLRLPLEAGVQGGGLLIGWFELYGSRAQPDTLLILKPGEWIRVKGDLVVLRSFATDQTVTASTDFWLVKYVLPAEENNNIVPSNQRCILQVAGTSMTAHMQAEAPR